MQGPDAETSGVSPDPSTTKLRYRDAATPLAVAGMASIVAGLIHAAAIGSHADLTGLSRLFTATAVAQVAVGIAAMTAAGSRVATLLVGAVNAAALLGWIASMTVGIGWVSGLEQPATPGLADTAAAVLAAVAVIVAVATAVSRPLAGLRIPVTGLGILLGVLALPAIVDAASDSHAHSHGDAGHGDAGHDDSATGGAHQHDRLDELLGDHAHDGEHDDGHDDAHDDAVVPPTPYDPSLPIDLGGIDGVTPEQQAFAENLVAVTLRYLPQWADPAVAEAAGFRTIGDGATGHEHFIQWDWINDDVWLDPTQPESLVYEPQPDGSRRLVSAMFMLPSSTELSEIPDWGGPLMQWHVHDDLCFTPGTDAPRVAAVIEIGGTCPPNLVKMEPAPMIHVWIRPHECGPFAALDGIGAGQVQAGEEHFCNHVHGAG